MAIAQRTATSGTAASGAGFSITLPASTAVGDMLVVGIASATPTGVTAPTGWTRQYSASAGTLQNLAVYTAPYSAGLTLAFTNVAALSAWVCNSYFQAGSVLAFDAVLGASSTGNNATLPTGAPVTGTLAGDFEVLLYAWTSAATISGVASGSTIEITRANSTTISVALGRNNTTSLGGSVTCTAFSQTLSASNTRKSGVGLLLELVPVYKDLTGTSGGSSGTSNTLSKKRPLVGTAGGVASASGAISLIPGTFPKDISGRSDGRARVGGLGFVWGSSNWAAPEAIWGATGATVITGGPPVAGPKNLYGTATGQSTAAAAITRRRALVVASQGVATVSGSISRRRALSGTSQGLASVSVSVSRRRALVATAAGLSTTVASVSARRSMAVLSAGSSTVSGFVDKAGSIFKPLLSTVAGSATVTATLTVRRALSGTSTGVTTVTGSPARRRLLSSTSAGQATVSSTPTRRRALVASIAGVATTGGTLSRRPQLTGTSAGVASVSGAPSRRRALIALAAGVSTVTGLLTKRVPIALVSLSAGQATVTGVLSKAKPLTGTSAGSSSVTADLTLIPGIPMTSVIWVGNHFEQSRTGRLVQWAETQFVSNTDRDQVIWDEARFKEFQR